MPEGISDRIPITTGIPQGSLILLIFYLIYNADLIKNCGRGAANNSQVDNIYFMAKEDSEREAIKKLRSAC